MAFHQQVPNRSKFRIVKPDRVDSQTHEAFCDLQSSKEILCRSDGWPPS
jgi:hypothetical protein